MGTTWLQKHPVRCRTVVGSNQADTTKGYTLKFTGHSNPRRRSLTLIRIDFATEQSVPVGGEDQDGILGFASDYSTPSRQPESPCSLSNG